jgi:hypothetical protein
MRRKPGRGEIGRRIPIGIEDCIADHPREHRGRIVGPPDDHLHAVLHDPILDHVEPRGGGIDHDVTPRLDRRGKHARAVHVEPQDLRLARIQHPRHRVAQLAINGVHPRHCVEPRRQGRRGRCRIEQKLGARCRGNRRRIGELHNPRPEGTHVARISDKCLRQHEVGTLNVTRIAAERGTDRTLEIADAIGIGIEPVEPGGAHEVDQLARFRPKLAVADPDRALVARLPLRNLALRGTIACRGPRRACRRREGERRRDCTKQDAAKSSCRALAGTGTMTSLNLHAHSS